VTTICGFEVHEAAEMFPLMQGDVFESFVNDIRDNGLMEPIVLDSDGRLIDGRNRARACEQLKIVPSTKEFAGAIVRFVITHNLHRRHLTDSQRAMVAARLARRRPGNFSQIELVDINEFAPTQHEVAAMMCVTTTSIQKAKQVTTSGTTALQDLVADGEAPVATAARVATTLSSEEQNDYVANVRAGADPVKAAPPAPNWHRPKAPSPSPPKPRGTVEDRFVIAGDMAEHGHSTRQIAERLGYSVEGMREFLKRHGVDVPADRIVGKTHRLNSTRIVTGVIDSVNGIGVLFDQIDFATLPPENVSGWLDILTESIRSLTTLRNRLKETSQP
jgi:hypothetical protein